MIRVLFVCHGNICRSPMSEYILKDMVAKTNQSTDFHIASAATSTEEIGNPVYPPARRKLAEHGIFCDGHHARQITRADYQKYDYLIVMDRMNLRNLKRIIPNDPDHKVYMLLDFTDHPGEIADPWYTGDFETTYRQVVEGCQGFLKKVKGQAI